MAYRSIDELCEELHQKREESQSGGGAKAVEKQKAKGKWTARERIEKLLDAGTFVELEVFPPDALSRFYDGRCLFPGSSCCPQV
jgi:acetyl-CoA carboxylase carboxyltransferase component